jgi:PPOX class probable FMN-dependent enzyme
MPPLPPWRSPLTHALHCNRSLPHSKFIQLATVDPQGRPHNRTIVYRGLLNSSSDLKFITDSRSDKISHLEHQPWVEVCWYFTKTREQFRFSGTMQMLKGNPTKPSNLSPEQDLRVSTWKSLSKNAQCQFYWPSPGQARSPESKFTGIEPSPLPPENFVLLLLKVHEVEHLQLRGNPQSRDRYFQQDAESWGRESLNP